jgi:sialate O-acetylesterase
MKLCERLVIVALRLSLALMILCGVAAADVRLPALLSENAVLQRDIPVRIWGNADPGETVTVRFRTETATARADDIGRWTAYLRPLSAGGPDDLVVSGKNTITVRNVLVGDVWVASGQSNMQWSVRQSNDPDKEMAAARHPRIRLFKVPLKSSEYVQEDVDAAWRECAPESVADFSAVAYYFGRDLHQKLQVPVGLVQTAWGGTPAESWTSLPTLSSDPALNVHLTEWARNTERYPENVARHRLAMEAWKQKAAQAKAEGKQPPNPPGVPQGPGHPWMPGGLFNAMIAPLTNYAIRGAIWYQGESNAGPPRAVLYNRLFETMIKDWRRAWGQGDFPFLFVQLANYAKVGERSQWPELREAQLQTLSLKNTGMAVTIDIGDSNDIHPRNKQDVGMRLARAARAISHGESLEYSGPIYRQMTLEQGSIRLWFDHAKVLAARGGTLKGFQVAGADRKFVTATARIDGSTVVVSSAEVQNPVAVRYAWAADPEANLTGAEGLPASPFRTDRWQ